MHTLLAMKGLPTCVYMSCSSVATRKGDTNTLIICSTVVCSKVTFVYVYHLKFCTSYVCSLDLHDTSSVLLKCPVSKYSSDAAMECMLYLRTYTVEARCVMSHLN